MKILKLLEKIFSALSEVMFRRFLFLDLNFQYYVIRMIQWWQAPFIRYFRIRSVLFTCLPVQFVSSFICLIRRYGHTSRISCRAKSGDEVCQDILLYLYRWYILAFASLSLKKLKFVLNLWTISFSVHLCRFCLWIYLLQFK